MSLSAALKNKTAWYYSTNNIIWVPIMMIALLAAGSATHLLTIDHVAFVMMATPVATVVVNYAIAFNHQSLMASNASLISTIFATMALPFWIIAV